MLLLSWLKVDVVVWYMLYVVVWLVYLFVLVFVVEVVQCFLIFFVDCGCVWKCVDCVCDVVFVQQVQDWIWCVVGVVFDVVGFGVVELVLWMEVCDLQYVVEL